MTSRVDGGEEDLWTILRVLEWTDHRFLRAGIDAPRLTAEVLLADCLGVDRVRLYMDYAKPLRQAELSRYRQTIRRRLAGEPLAYITGAKEFWSLTLLVDRAVLIPRPETELLVERAIQRAPRRDPLTVVDVGTGSGAVAIALASELPQARVLATEVSQDALAVARSNVERHDVEVELLLGDLLAPLPPDLAPDLVTANLPYVRRGELAGLQREIVEWEPQAALDGGDDGLDLVRRLVQQCPRTLAPGGVLLLEIGHDQGTAVCGLMESAGFAEVEVLQDLAGCDRIVAGTLP
jgi:release factor glutamine methyltransferase